MLVNRISYKIKNNTKTAKFVNCLKSQLKIVLKFSEFKIISLQVFTSIKSKISRLKYLN